MANLTNSNKLIGKISQMESDISNIRDLIPSDGVGEGVVSLKVNNTDVDSFNVNQSTNKSINITVDKTTVGLGNVDNTSDLDKPVSTATWTELDKKANKSDLTTVYRYMGSVANSSELPTEDQNIGDVYNLEDTGMNVAWNGTEWDNLGSTVDLSNYYNKTEVDNLLDTKADASDIPTVNDATLDIQLNGSSIETFSANAATNKTVNIEVTKTTVGLGNVDNTADTDKPISTATQAALDLKADKSELPTVNDARITIQKNGTDVDSFTLNQSADNSVNISLDKTDVGLSNVDNTSDLNKPISTATQAALDLKADKTEIKDATITIKQGTATKGTFTLNQDTDATIQLDEGSSDAIEYNHFEFVAMTGNSISDLSSTKDISADVTLTAGSDLKEGMQYLVRVTNTDSSDHDVTFDGVPYTVKAGETKSFVFLAVDDSTLELQECTGGGGGGQTPNDGVLTITDKGGNTLGTFTADQASDTSVVVGNMSYEDFHSVNDTTSASIPLQLTGEVSPTQNFTLQAGTYKEGLVYIMRITNGSSPYTMSLGAGLTNPFNVDLTLTPNSTDQFVFLAINDIFELQPEILTRASVEQILRDYNLIP